jgi:hypothetical protein
LSGNRDRPSTQCVGVNFAQCATTRTYHLHISRDDGEAHSSLATQ